MVAGRCCVVRRLGGNRACNMAFGRFLGNPKVSAAAIFEAAGADTGAKAAGRHVLALQDTSNINFPQRGSSPGGLGPGGDGKLPGLFLHPVLCVDADSDQLLGLASGRVWTRDEDKVDDRRSRGIEQRESARWIEEGQKTKQALSQAAHVTLIGDRESDIYEHWTRLPDDDFDLLARARHNRKLTNGKLLFEQADEWREIGRKKIAITARKDREKRQAELVMRIGKVEIARPKQGVGDDAPERVTLSMVDVREAGAPAGVPPVHWRLLTTHKVESAADGWRMVRYYQQRWRIEEYFRILKRSGMNVQKSQLQTGEKLINLVAMGAVAGVPVMQLVEGRDAGPEHRAKEVIEPQQEEFAAALCDKLEGKTEKQKNPHQPGSLAWIAWIIGRLGGWDGYYGKPGPKTMASGWWEFHTMYKGWMLMK